MCFGEVDTTLRGHNSRFDTTVARDLQTFSERLFVTSKRFLRDCLWLTGRHTVGLHSPGASLHGLRDLSSAFIRIAQVRLQRHSAVIFEHLEVGQFVGSLFGHVCHFGAGT